MLHQILVDLLRLNTSIQAFFFFEQAIVLYFLLQQIALKRLILLLQISNFPFQGFLLFLRSNTLFFQFCYFLILFGQIGNTLSQLLLSFQNIGGVLLFTGDIMGGRLCQYPFLSFLVHTRVSHLPFSITVLRLRLFQDFFILIPYLFQVHLTFVYYYFQLLKSSFESLKIQYQLIFQLIIHVLAHRFKFYFPPFFFSLLQSFLISNLPYIFLLQQQQQQIATYLMLKERKNLHRKNPSSTLVTGRSKRTSQQKSQSKQKTSREKSKNNKQLNGRMLKRMSFQSPSKKQDDPCSKNFSLLNYMIFKEKSFKGAVPGSKPINRELFLVKEVLGKGGFGRVMKVEYKKNRKLYAMKEMSKTVIITKKSIQSVLNERELLSQLRNKFLVNMIFAFQDRSNLFLIMDLMQGGDLRYQIGRFGSFPEHIVKFFVCCIIVGLEYLHSNNIIHRDIKPQNLVLDAKGFLRITDLGVARLYSPENYKDTSGTPGYMAPQVINRQNHSFLVDFFATGVIAYECMLGKRPYKGYNRQQIRQQMLLYEASIKKHQIPAEWNPESADFINKMLKRKPQQRLGGRGIHEIKSHPWFNDIDWEKMEQKKYPSPFMPNLNERNYDTVSVSEYDDEYLDKMAENALLLKQKQVQELFKGYEYQQVKFS